tara:strand:+ start:200 stop:721 length:522 start_codon:yes stop_codon:yes gene_type:complete
MSFTFKFMKRYIEIIDSINNKFGRLAGWLTTLMVINVFVDVLLRYGLDKVSIAMQELEWHFFAAIFLLGAGHTLKQNGHVRVDLLYNNFNDRQKAWVNLTGSVLFLLPFAAMVFFSSQDFFISSFQIKETSPDPGGLPARYILKAIIPIGFALLFAQGVSESFKNILFLKGEK